MKDWRIHHALSRWPKFFGLNEADQADLVRRVQSLIAEDRQENRLQQRRPLTDEQIDRLDTEAIHGGPDSQYAFRFARAIERAHGNTGEPT